VLLHYLAKARKHGTCIFSLKCFITALLDFNQLLLGFINLVDLQFILMLLNDAVNFVINGDHPWALGAMNQEKKSRS